MIRRRSPLFSALAVFVAATLAAASASRATIITPVLPLSSPTATENTFTTTVVTLGSQDVEQIIYTGVLRPVMDIDFSNPVAPTVISLDLAGHDGDVQHSDVTFSVPLGTAEFNGITGRVKTAPGHSPAPVTGGAFNGSDHQLIAWHGTIDVTPAIGAPFTIDLFDDTFTGNFNGTGNSSVAVLLNNVTGNVATYDVEIKAVMDNTQMTTGDPQIDSLISIFISGNFVARGQITQAVPEPATVVTLLAMAVAGLVVRRRRNR
jgi:hypothetical protein